MMTPSALLCSSDTGGWVGGVEGGDARLVFTLPEYSTDIELIGVRRLCGIYFFFFFRIFRNFAFLLKQMQFGVF